MRQCGFSSAFSGLPLWLVLVEEPSRTPWVDSGGMQRVMMRVTTTTNSYDASHLRIAKVPSR